ncbi:GNAT family N-acetyltransferase [Sulfitobacter aestuarii]|uniref:GNAT family N-acetyltransferase n=1 Tax=Sulfitobacter aestuarii TaxID=2161676 RepID=A0ABW5U3S9_9RHOB
MSTKTSSPFTWRPLGLEDISKIADWFWDFEDVALFDRGLPVPVNIDAMRESWRSSLDHAQTPRAFWFIAEDANETPAGIAGLEAVNYIHGDAIVPAFVAEPFRKKGLATAMSVALIELAFQQLRLHRLTTYYRDGNTATLNALQTIGFTEEGRFREGWFVGGTRRDVVIVGLLASEWAGRRDRVLAKLPETCRAICCLQGGNAARA